MRDKEVEAPGSGSGSAAGGGSQATGRPARRFSETAGSLLAERLRGEGAGPARPEPGEPGDQIGESSAPGFSIDEI